MPDAARWLDSLVNIDGEDEVMSIYENPGETWLTPDKERKDGRNR